MYQQGSTITNQVTSSPHVMDEGALTLSPNLTPSEPLSRSCRICLSEGDEIDNPLIAPCECSGTMKWVHAKCLAFWLKSRCQERSGQNVCTIYWKNLDCELCKSLLPGQRIHSQLDFLEQVTSEEKKIDLIPIPSIKAPSILIEILSKEEKAVVRGIHIANFSLGKSLKLGRGNDCEIRINDISVSRHHATLHYDSSSHTFWFEDNSSKFGALLRRRSTLIKDDRNAPADMQVGRTIFHFAVEAEKRSYFASCFR